MTRYVSAIGYQRNLLAGTPRIDLQGNPAGIATKSDEAGAWEARRAFVEQGEDRKRRAAKRGPRVTLADLKRAAQAQATSRDSAA